MAGDTTGSQDDTNSSAISANGVYWVLVSEENLYAYAPFDSMILINKSQSEIDIFLDGSTVPFRCPALSEFHIRPDENIRFTHIKYEEKSGRQIGANELITRIWSHGRQVV